MRGPALLAVVALHLAIGHLLLQQARPPLRPGAAAAQRTELRLIPGRLPAPLPSSTAQPPARLALARPGPNAISLPAAQAGQAGGVEVAPPAPSAAALSASAPAPLDLRLPAGSVATAAPTLADRLRADPRANSPWPSAEQQMAQALGAGETVVIDGVQGGRMIRGPNGACTLVRPTMMQEIDPGNERWRAMPAKASDCSQLQPGARRTPRPP